MRKVIYQQWLSLDGCAADANGSVQFIESTTMNKYSDLQQLRWLDTIDTILLGANTYKLFVEFWPTATNDDEIIADKLNSIPKTVFSKSLKAAPWGKWPAANIVATDAVQALRELKSQPGKNIVLWGSISLSQPLIKANLIDEYHFRVCPIVLANGRRQFESTGYLEFDLYDSGTHESGLVELKYRQRPKRTDTASCIIKASPEKIYSSFLDPQAIASWRPPKGMKCRIYSFDKNEGYRMAFEYENTMQGVGKTTEKADVFTGKFIELIPGKRIVELAEFESADPLFAGSMILTTELTPVTGGTAVKFIAENVPVGISEKDHHAGMMSSLNNLAEFIEGK
jgi:dihydrofolate reductase/uncharacterized protein YndB with AHSA1/START domain